MRAAALIAAVALLAPAPAAAAAGDAPTVVWIAERGEGRDELFPIAAGWVEELGILVVREEVAGPVDALEAQRFLLSHRAFAAIWHDASGALRVSIAGADGIEQLAVPAGTPAEEGLYLRELIAGRRAAGVDLSLALVTVPDEIVAAAAPPPPPPPPAVLPMEERAAAGSIRGFRLGVGYGAAAHFDDVAWWQHALRFVVPALRLSDRLKAQAELELGLPASIGAAGSAWLEFRTVCVAVGAGVFPIRGERLELEVGLSAGPLYTDVVAFLPDGESARKSHTAGHLTAHAAVVFHLRPRFDVRVRVDGRYVLRPAGFGIGGRGDFGGNPWQPAAGVDLAFALF